MARFAFGHVVSAMAVLALALGILAPFYGYHRDELYFRMLPPAWGYTDQPPLTPLLAHAAIALFGDSVVALRIVSLVCAVASLPILALITREAGGGRLAQAFTAWGMAGSSMTLAFGHVFLTASLDLIVWPAALLFVIRALMRDDGRWWPAAGTLIGLSSANKLLVVVLLAGIGIGLAVCGPWEWWRGRRSLWLWGGVVLAAVCALPALVYQATHGWPQLLMGAALGEDNADEVRAMLWLFLIVMPGPVLAFVWAVGLVGILRRPEWRPIRLLAVVLAVVVAFVFTAGTQAYYANGVLAVLVALGTVPIAGWVQVRRRNPARSETVASSGMTSDGGGFARGVFARGGALARRGRGRRYVWSCLIAVNGVGCAIASVPIMPPEWFGRSGLAAVNASTAEQVGWEKFAAQVQAAVHSASEPGPAGHGLGGPDSPGDGEAGRAGVDAIIASNYGEAGALDRFGRGLPPVVSGHNALWDLGGPPPGAARVLIVGGQGTWAPEVFETCRKVGTVSNAAGVDNEERGESLTLCSGPTADWDQLWPRFRHLD